MEILKEFEGLDPHLLGEWEHEVYRSRIV